MSRRRRPELAAEARRRCREQCARLGGEVRRSRRARRLTQQALGVHAGVSQSLISQVERGESERLSLETIQRIFIALDRLLVLEAGRDRLELPADAGHLEIQELLLRIGRATGRARTFELATRPSDPVRSTDVGLRDDRYRALILIECWNTFGDLGSAARSSRRKVAEAEALAIAIGGDRAYTVHRVWVVRATRRNRALVRRYPEIFASELPGSSRRWVAALMRGGPPPAEAGLVWAVPERGRLVAFRRRSYDALRP